RVAEHAAALAGHQERDVNAFLHIAARFLADLPHFSRHGTSEALLVVRQELAEAIQDLAALGCRGSTPEPARCLSGSDGARDVGRRAALEVADQVAAVRRIATLEGAPGLGRHPFARDVEVEGRDVLRGRVGLRRDGFGHLARFRRRVRTPLPPIRRHRGIEWPARSGLSANCYTASWLATTVAAARSVMPGALPAVTVPSVA